MKRSYSVQPTMFEDRFTQKVVQPDAALVESLHRMLDTLPDDTAYMIDHTVAQLLRFHDPNQKGMRITIHPPEDQPLRIIPVPIERGLLN